MFINSSLNEHYQVLARGSQPVASICEPFQSTDYASVFHLISRQLTVSAEQWRSVLLHVGIFVPPNFFHTSDIYAHVTRLCLRGELVFYKLPRLEHLPALSTGDGWGYCFVPGPEPYRYTHYHPVMITSLQMAEALLTRAKATETALRTCVLAITSLRDLFYVPGSIRPRFIELLTSRKLLAYKIPVQSATPSAKAMELVPATVVDKPVPLAPETKSKPAIISSVPSTTNPAPQSLDDCAQGLIEARKKLDTEGYKAKYTDAQQRQKVDEGSVSQERFLVSFQTQNNNPDAKLAFQRDSGLAPLWATSFDQLENADTDPQLIADVLGTPYDPAKDYVLHIIDRGETFNHFGQNTLVPTWKNMQAPTQLYLGGKHEPAILAEVMTPEYQKEYASDMLKFSEYGLKEFNVDHQKLYAESLPLAKEEKFLARHNVRTEMGANSEFTGNGLTQSREGSTQYGVVETLTLENNPLPITKMANVKTIPLKPRGLV